MSSVTLTSKDTGVTRRVVAPTVEWKADWSDTWATVTGLTVTSISRCAAGQDLDACIITRRYGRLAYPGETALSAKTPWSGGYGYWLRVRWAGEDGGDYVAFIGQIRNVTDDIAPTDAGDPTAGVQSWTAYGPANILRRIHVDGSYWWESTGDDPYWLGRLPGVNTSDGGYQWNRSLSTAGNGAYAYGDGAKWTYRQYIEYLLANFADESPIGGPSWELTGASSVLDVLTSLTAEISFGSTATLFAMLRKLIPKNYGLDFDVRATDAGFAVHVYSLAAQSLTVGSTTFPANADTATITAGSGVDWLKTQIVDTGDQLYGRIRILGKRIVVCCSLHGAAHFASADDATLVPKWSDDDETDYQTAAGSPDDAELNDAARKDERYSRVYTHYGIPYFGYDHLGGEASPLFDADGGINAAYVLAPSTHYAPWQIKERKTLNWTPLYAGVDYTLNPPVGDPDTYEELPPQAWVNHYNDVYAPVDSLDMGVSVPNDDWGVIIRSAPAHNLARTHWSTGNASACSPEFDYDTLAATIAYETDHRIGVEYTASGARPSDGTITIETDAECWVLCPNTVVGVDTDGALKYSATTHCVLRNDTETLAFELAGAMVRYGQTRHRAAITVRGMRDWGRYIGYLVPTVDVHGTAYTVAAPITKVTWDFSGKLPTTRISAGFAR